jgi:hypothetical protein
LVQQVTKRGSALKSLAVTPTAVLGTSNRLVVEVGVWSSANATTSAVTDSAGDTFTEVSHFTGPDQTEQSIWTAPVTSGAGKAPKITAKLSSTGDAAVAALEYSGLSTASGGAAVDQVSHASGTTTGAASVSSGPTAPTAGASELAIGFYSDSGFGDNPTAGPGFTQRAKIASNNTMELLAEDQVVGAGATPAATVTTGANTVWEMATVVFAPGKTATQTAMLEPTVAGGASHRTIDVSWWAPTPGAPVLIPGAPAGPFGVRAVAGNGSARVTWSAPTTGPVPLYTVTPYRAGVAQATTVVSGSPASTTANITGLTNGAAYAFTVTATNHEASGPPSLASRPVKPKAVVAPSFVQRVGAHGSSVSGLAATTGADVVNGDRLVVEVAVHNAMRATADSVTDSAGDAFTELAAVTGSDGQELSVWTAPVSHSGGTRPTITARPTSDADMAMAVLEYKGVSRVADAADRTATWSSVTPSARAVSSGSTMAASASNELSVGFYADNGSTRRLGADPGYRPRFDLMSHGTTDLFAEDGVVQRGAAPAPSVDTGSHVPWEMATVVFKP